MLKFQTETILMTFMKHWPVCQLASYMAEIEVIKHNISKLWKVIHSKTAEYMISLRRMLNWKMSE